MLKRVAVYNVNYNGEKIYIQRLVKYEKKKKIQEIFNEQKKKKNENSFLKIMRTGLV